MSGMKILYEYDSIHLRHYAYIFSIFEEQIVTRMKIYLFLTGFGDAVNNSECWNPVIKYVEDQYDDFLDSESKVERFPITDSRVHVCLYFIAPTGHCLKPLDIEFMKRIHEKVRVVQKFVWKKICSPGAK